MASSMVSQDLQPVLRQEFGHNMSQQQIVGPSPFQVGSYDDSLQKVIQQKASLVNQRQASDMAIKNRAQNLSRLEPLEQRRNTSDALIKNFTSKSILKR